MGTLDLGVSSCTPVASSMAGTTGSTSSPSRKLFRPFLLFFVFSACVELLSSSSAGVGTGSGASGAVSTVAFWLSNLASNGFCSPSRDLLAWCGVSVGVSNGVLGWEIDSAFVRLFLPFFFKSNGNS